MRISDWSSDVCSSDLPGSGRTLPDLAATPLFSFAAIGLKIDVDTGVVNSFPCATTGRSENVDALAASIVWSRPLRRLIERKRVVSGKSVAIGVELGGRRMITKKKSQETKPKKE